MVNFRANLIGYTTVNKLGSDNVYRPYKVSLVELDRNTPSDAENIRKVSQLWSYGSTFAEDISVDLSCNQNEYSLYSHLGWNDGKRFFALTSQKSDFYELNPRKVLALSEMTEDSNFKNAVWLDYLQVNPKFTHKNAENKLFKGVGRSLLNSMVNIYSNLTIYLEPVRSAIEFYRKCGFNTLKELQITEKTMAYAKKTKI